jgi:hypothetical protein
MATLSSQRHRSSTATSTPPAGTASSTEIRELLNTLKTASASIHEKKDPNFSVLVKELESLRQLLSASLQLARARDVFRHAEGFQILLDTLRAASGYYHPGRRTSKDKAQLFDLVGGILAVLSEAFHDHHGNRKYFKKRVDGGGWAALEQGLASIGLGGLDGDAWSNGKLFGYLFAFAMNESTLLHLFDGFRLEAVSPRNGTDAKEFQKEGVQSTLESSKSNSPSGEISGGLFAPNSMLYNPEIISTIVSFWKTIPRSKGAENDAIALMVIQALSTISGSSKFNLVAVHSSAILPDLLPLAFEEESLLPTGEKYVVERLCASLMSLGVSSLDDARYIVCSKSEAGHDFLLEEMKASHSPPHIQFDMSLHGFSSIELPTLGRTFPPPATVQGYTFTAWIYIDQFDPNAHTTIFGAFDSSQTCFVLAYLEKDTKNFILQTSVTSSRPSVRFKSIVFKEHRWYHIGIVHRRPRTISSSKAALYVDGEFAEQVKCQYPASPPPPPSGTDSFASFTGSHVKQTPVQAFVGTPQDLSSRLGRNLVNSKWSLASAHLFEDTLSDDLMAVHYRLGPRYNGNFQDCLGSFQTYGNSAVLGMRNEMMHPGKDEKSDISAATRDKASTVMPESRTLLSILPTAILHDEDLDPSGESPLLRNLSRNAASSLLKMTRNGGYSVAVNTAIPSINEALNHPAGAAILTGNPVVVAPQSLDDAMWRLGGCSAVGLKLIESAHTREGIVRAVETLLESIKGSWRNSEAMERDNGYAILGALIRGKVGAGTVISSKDTGPINGGSMSTDEREKLSFELLSLVLGFIGYDHQNPEESVIINPLAYRILLVDFDMWRKAAPITQTLYYKQFVTFGVKSKFHQWNSRRLFRMSKNTSSPHSDLY